MERIRIKDLPKAERPYEKCLRQGPGSLSDAELLAVIIRTGSREDSSLELASKVLALGGPGEGLSGLLHHSLADFDAVKGIGPAKGVQLLCVGELSRRIWKSQSRSRTLTFTEPGQVADYYMEDLRHLEQEEIRVMYLNTKQALIRESLLSMGTVNTSVVTPREILINALGCQAVGMILVHNHPSGDVSPSKADILLTKRVKAAGEVVGISLVDHIIIGDRRFLSFRQEKLI